MVCGLANSAQDGIIRAASRRVIAGPSAGMLRRTVTSNQQASNAPTSQLSIPA